VEKLKKTTILEDRSREEREDNWQSEDVPNSLKKSKREKAGKNVQKGKGGGNLTSVLISGKNRQIKKTSLEKQNSKSSPEAQKIKKGVKRG